jgi:hypothetical protein
MRARDRSCAVAIAVASLCAACALNTTGGTHGKGSISAGCLDTLAANDTVRSIVRLTLAPQDSTTTLPFDFDNVFIEELKPRFHAPAQIPLRVIAGWEPCDSAASRCAGGILNLATTAYFTAHHDGRLTRISIVDESLTPALVDSLNRALRRLSAAKTAAWSAPPDSILLQLRLAPYEGRDSVADLRGVFTSVVPRYDLPFSAAIPPAGGVKPSYPISAELTGVEDTVVVAFTVDSDGLVVSESLELLGGKYRDFVGAVVNALLDAQYHPARLGDCAVAARMRQRFVFAGKE